MCHSHAMSALPSQQLLPAVPARSCEGTLRGGDPKGERRQNAHVQSYAMATDQVAAPLSQSPFERADQAGWVCS